mgnify:CR=1 FL=1
MAKQEAKEEDEDIDDEDYFNALGNRFFYLYNMLRNADHSAQFQLTPEQQQLFNSTFERWQEELSHYYLNIYLSFF